MDPADLGSDSLPPPPPVIPSAVASLKAPDVKKSRPTRALVARSGFGTKGQKIQLLTNHFKVSMPNSDGHFFQYSVALYYEDGTAANAKGIGRRVVDKVFETYDSELAGRTFAYDGEKSLFTLGPLPNNKLEFTVVLDEQASHRPVGQSSSGDHDYPTEAGKKRFKRPIRSKSYNVCISYATKVPLQAIASALRGQESVQFQEAVRVLDIVLRQHAAKQGCLLVRQSFFHNDPKNFVDIGGGVLGCRGFHSSFRATQGGLSLNIDVSTTMIVRPGPVIDFLLANQNVNNPSQIDWARAKRMLKNLRIKVKTTNMEYKVSGLSDKICYDQTFELKKRNGGEVQTDVITVYDYFVRHRDIKLQYSGEFPCINVGRPKSASYFPIELCDLVSLQRYTKALSNQQRASVVERSRQKPRERLEVLSDALKTSNYGSDALLRSSRISISPQFTQVQGRVLSAPRVLYAGPEPSGCTLFIRYLNSVLELQGIYPHLKAGGGENFFPRNGRWNFNNKKLADPAKIDRWAIVNFSARCDNGSLARDLIKCGEKKGITISHPFCALDERGQDRRASASIRVEKMFEQVKAQLPGPPQLIVCVLPERKNCDIYGPWKRKCLAELGIATQCIAPTRMNDQYLTNVLLKINAKVGGINSLLSVENTPSMPLVSRAPTVIVGMDVSHGSPGRSDLPSIAAVVSSRGWPFISRYRASVRTQSPKVEMIDGLFKASVEPDGQKRDDGMFREALMDFYMSSEKRKPMQIIIFRDGVSEYQFNQVLNIELEQIKEACKFLDESWSPKFAVIVAQKNHHTKFFLPDSPDNVPPGTVIDNMICHPRNNDFYMCAHAGMIGTTRPTHYHLLYDELGFSADDLQELVHSLSYVYQRSTTAVSLVAPICYAHLAASQMTQFIKFDDTYEKSSSHGGLTSVGTIPVPELPKLHRRVSNSMFFC